MKRPLHGLAGWLALSLLLWAPSGLAQADERPASSSNPKFHVVDRLLAEHVERKQIAGAVALVVHEGHVVYSTAVGMRDREAGAAMTPDTIFRIASMTKPVTSVAIMMLRDEGRLALDDPLSKYLPEFASPRVIEVDREGRHRTVPAGREITIRDLLTHTSGLAYGFGAPPPLAERYAQLGIADGLVEIQGTIADNARRLAQSPLANQPGEAWQYGLSTDVLGRVVEVVSGKTLDEFFRERIFTPLGMKDTHFRLPREKLPRLAALYRPGENGTSERVGEGPQRHGAVTYSTTFPYSGEGTYFSGGAGLVSTAADYARFLEMLRHRGEFDGVRLLKPGTVAEMTRNQIGELDILFTVHGDKFGLGFGVHTEENNDRNGASVGTYSWGGIFHTYFWVDPQREVVGVLMTQLYPFDHLTLWGDFQQRVYDALGETSEQHGARGPQPGDVYREYAVHNGGNRAWRVTDPEARAAGAQEFLPNPALKLEVGDLQDAVRAEALLDRWGGHIRTTNKRIRFNGNAWLHVPELTTTPAGRAEYYYSQDNPVIDVPLSHVKEGTNTLEATCSALENDAWGQWGLYSLILRVYYDPARKPHPSGRILQPVDGDSLGENPTVELECSDEAARVDVLAWYDGYDEDGDGVFSGWHGSHHQPARGEPADLADHVGTITHSPWRVIWNTRWVPDQKPDSIELIARIRDRDGIWFVTPPARGLSLNRRERVALYRAADVPERFGVRVGQQRSCTIPIPEDAPLDQATEAALALRTWHGWDAHHEPLDLNGRRFRIDGRNHHYDFDLRPVPIDVLRRGDDVFRISSQTEHHMLEVLWPGPALLVRYE